MILLYLVVLILVAVVLFGVGSVLFGRGERLPPLPRRTTATVLPASGVTRGDVETDVVVDDGKTRCGWALAAGTRPPTADSIMYRDYHDTEWGRPLHGAQAMFERMSLEAFQSGLSWLIILRK